MSVARRAQETTEAAPAEVRAPEQEGGPPAPAEAEPQPDEAAAPAPRATPGLLRGSLSLRYRGRFTGDDQDHDLPAVLALDASDPRVPWLAGHLLVRAEADLDGHDDGEVFEDLADTYDSSVIAKLYLANVDVALDTWLGAEAGTLRVGRQSDARLPEVLRLDGVSYVSGALGERAVELGLYAGIPVHLYESSPEGDRAFGTFVEGRPWKGGQARLDWMHLEDEQLLGEERDDLLALGLWQRLSPRWRVEGEHERLEGEARDFRVRALYADPATETNLRLGYYELLTTQVFLVEELDPFSDELLEHFPYSQATLDLSRAFGRHTLVEAVCDVRRVSEDEDVGEFNRDWERYRAAVTLRDAPLDGLELTLGADRWNDDDRDTESLSVDLAFAREAWRAALGSYFALFKYDFLELEESENVRTYYLSASRDVSQRLRLDLSYELEDDDLEIYHTLRLGALWRF